MKNQHITREEWLLFHTKRDAGISVRILSHAAVCEKCREIYDRSIDLAGAARALAEQRGYGYQDSGYAAVASREWTQNDTAGGTLCVDVDVNDGKAQFLAESIEAAGEARKYALNPNADGTCLKEDWGALTLEVQGSRLCLRVEEALRGKVSAEVRSAQTAQQLVFEGCEASAALPGDDLYVLEITFA